jgi:hypothetical protein
MPLAKITINKPKARPYNAARLLPVNLGNNLSEASVMHYYSGILAAFANISLYIM